jgi:hypothetical protein
VYSSFSKACYKESLTVQIPLTELIAEVSFSRNCDNEKFSLSLLVRE